MSLQIKKKFIENNAVDETKIRLSNDSYLKARNAADDGDINLFKVNATNGIEFNSLPVFSGEALATEAHVAAEIAALGSLFSFRGNYDADTNSPELADNTGIAGHVYRINVAGTHDFGSGDITFEIGDKVVFVGSAWEKWDVIDNELATADTGDLAEGTNLYFTDARAKTAAVVDSTAGSETDQAASVASMKSYVTTELAGVSQDFNNEVLTLIAGDITNEYVTLAETPIAGSLHLSIAGAPSIAKLGTDYSITGAQLDFLAPMIALVEAGDVLVIHYAY